MFVQTVFYQASFFIERKHEFFNSLLEGVGVNYHIRTLNRQLTGEVSTVAALVEDAMRNVVLRVNGMRTNLDIERALVADGLSVNPERRRPEYVSTDRIVPLAQLWLLLNPRQSRRSLAIELSGRLAERGVHLKVDPLQVILGGRQATARREILQALLELLSDHGISSEPEGRARWEQHAEDIARYQEARKLRSVDRLVGLALAWKVHTREPSSRRLAATLRDRLLVHELDVGLHQIQNALGGKAKNVRAVLVAEMEALLREALPAGEDLAEAVAKATVNNTRLIDLHWVVTKPIARLAQQWIAAHPEATMRQLAILVAKTARRMGYATSLNTVQHVLGGHQNRTRGFVYRAMLKQLPAGHGKRVPVERIRPSPWAETVVAAPTLPKATSSRNRPSQASSRGGGQLPEDRLLGAYFSAVGAHAVPTPLAMAQPYEVVSVRRAKPPPGGKGSYWYRYVIAFEGTNTIDGCRQGGLKAVTRAVEEIVAQMNERYRVPRYAVGKPIRVHPVLKKKTHK